MAVRDRIKTPPSAIDSRPSASSKYAYVYALWLLVAFNLLAAAMPATHALIFSTINGFATIALSVAMLIHLWRQESAAVLSPLSYVLIAAAAYHGIGVLFFTFSNEASREWVALRYAVPPIELLRVNLVVSTGLAILWTAATAVTTLISTEDDVKPPPSPLRITWVARYCFIVGFGALYVLVVPYVLGWSQFTLPGMFMLLVNVAYAAIFLMAIEFHRTHGKEFRLLLPIAILAGVAAGLLTTSKTYVVLSLLFYFMGRFYAERNFKSLALGAGIMLATYALLAPMILYVRDSVAGAPAKSVDATLSAWSDTFSGDAPVAEDGIQWGFLRLSYVSAEAFAISEFDAGTPGTSLADGLTNVLMPRLLFPDKPVRSLGRDFAAAYNNNPNNSISPGIFAEAYWNAGWLGLFCISAAAGAVIGLGDHLVVRVLRRKDWLMTPLCLALFLQLGLINGFFSITYIYMPVALIVLQLLLVGGTLPFRSVRTRHRAESVSETGRPTR